MVVSFAGRPGAMLRQFMKKLPGGRVNGVPPPGVEHVTGGAAGPGAAGPGAAAPAWTGGNRSGPGRTGGGGSVGLVACAPAPAAGTSVIAAATTDSTAPPRMIPPPETGWA